MIDNNKNIKEISVLLKRKPSININDIPNQLVVNSVNRNGMSVNSVFEKYLEAKRKLGLPTGNLSDNSLNIEEKLIYELVKNIFEEIQVNSYIKTAINPGIALKGEGVTADGVPVTIQGVTTAYGNGGAVIE